MLFLSSETIAGNNVMHRQTGYLITCFMALLVSAQIKAQTGFAGTHFNFQRHNFQGHAYDQNTGALIYTERHRVALDEQGEYQFSTVEYSDAQGEIFATKELNFGPTATTPSLRFNDLRTNHEVRVGPTDSTQNQPCLSVENQRDGQNKMSCVALDNAVTTVIDAGFDRLIQSQWQQLQQSKTIRFSFLVISRAEFVDFELHESARTSDTVSYTIRPSNFFVRLLVDPIYLTYERSTQRLLRFEGLTNIEQITDRKRSNNHYSSVIEYEYL